MRSSLCVAFAAILCGCTTTKDITVIDCPAPPLRLITLSPKLEKLPSTMTQQQVVEAWLADTNLYLDLVATHNALAEWGRAKCKWPRPILSPSEAVIMENSNEARNYNELDKAGFLSFFKR